MRLEGKTVLVTGAGQGIGRGIALRLAQEGADVGVNDLRQEAAEAVAGEVATLGRKALALQADVTRAVEVEAMVGRFLDRFGKIDILVNNAGIAGNALAPGPIETPLARSLGEEYIRELVGSTHLGRFGRPEEIGALCAYLASEEAIIITGQLIEVVSYK